MLVPVENPTRQGLNSSALVPLRLVAADKTEIHIRIIGEVNLLKFASSRPGREAVPTPTRLP